MWQDLMAALSNLYDVLTFYTTSLHSAANLANG